MGRESDESDAGCGEGLGKLDEELETKTKEGW